MAGIRNFTGGLSSLTRRSNSNDGGATVLHGDETGIFCEIKLHVPSTSCLAHYGLQEIRGGKEATNQIDIL